MEKKVVYGWIDRVDYDEEKKERNISNNGYPRHIVYVFHSYEETGIRFFAEIPSAAETYLFGSLPVGTFKTDFSTIRDVSWNSENRNIPNKSYKMKSYDGDITVTTIMVTFEKFTELLKDIDNFVNNYKVGDSPVLTLRVGKPNYANEELNNFKLMDNKLEIKDEFNNLNKIYKL